MAPPCRVLRAPRRRWTVNFIPPAPERAGVSPVGAVIGAMTLTLAGSFLSFLRIPPDWQIGAQGAILILVLALRVAIDRTGARPA